MSSIWGKNIKISIFGESHGQAIGVVIDNLPCGQKLDLDEINIQMQRRSPGKETFSTSRNENDFPNIISGLINNTTTGTPLCAIIKNINANPLEYSEVLSLPRPSHADYTGNIRYKGFQDLRGGGHFSGRLTAPLTFAGTICRQILLTRNIKIAAHISSIGDIYDENLDDINYIDNDLYVRLTRDDFPVINEYKKNEMLKLITSAKQHNDSVGGTIQCIVYGLPAGIGNPIFENIESVISSIMFSIPAVKGIEFGKGFELSKMFGSIANDAFFIEDDIIKTKTNNNGGILGGISNGMPISFRITIKPTPSISQTQHTVNLQTRENDSITINGRHDPCIVPRAVPVVESALAIALLDLMVGEF